MPRTTFVRFYDPEDVMDLSSETTDDEIKEYCFRVNHYNSEIAAFDAYANTHCQWSTLLQDDEDVQKFIDKAWQKIVYNDIAWLEQHFV